ncbi:hypothetical protein ROV31_06035 [Pasteurella multocida]|uniref:hypothetical protein n=1 Tax=Pasteurella multocida TaxID=747 RepID=UPI002C4BC5FA|nr:hypothetical protein [Pasteurella multocida]MEB3470133.1 hypothetical protein [Pasteurella multocida]
MSEMKLSEQQNAVALATQALTQDMAEAHEAMGMLKAFSFVEKLLTVSSLKVLSEIKNSKKYKGLSYIDQDGKVLTISSWEDYCTACGFSRQKIDLDLQNLAVLGEDFLETSQRLGLGYREMRKLRQLPEDARAEIIDADYSEATDKEDLIEKIEDLTAKFTKEKTELEAKLKRKNDDYEAQSKVLANKNARIDELDTKLAKKEQAIALQSPEEKGSVLREETARISYKAEAILRGQVWQAFEALEAHSNEHGIDHKQFMSGVLAEYQLILSELKTHFGLNDTPTGDHSADYVGFVGEDHSSVVDALFAESK